MKFRDQKSEQLWGNLDDCRVKEFAEKWANTMEQMLTEGVSVSDVALKAFEESVKEIDINGIQEYLILSLLDQHWYLGRELYHVWVEED